jgi:hypothetical protein
MPAPPKEATTQVAKQPPETEANGKGDVKDLEDWLDDYLGD